MSTHSDTCQDPCVGDDATKITCVGYNGNIYNNDTVFTRIRSLEVINEDDGTELLSTYASWATCPTDDVASCSDSDVVAFDESLYTSVSYEWDNEDTLACIQDMSPDFDAQVSDINDRQDCVQFQKQTLKGCFCLTAMIESLETYGIMEGAQMVIDEYEEMCGTFAQQYVTAQTLVIGSAAMVSVINVILSTAIKAMAAFEHHKSLSAQTKAISSQIAITMFVNTALIIMIVHAAIEVRREGAGWICIKLFF